MRMQIPIPLKPNDTIAITAPSGFIIDKAALSRAALFYRSAGFRVRVGETCLTDAPDDMKVRELTDFFCDDGISGIVCARGGSGCIRLLSQIDWRKLARHPKVFCGYSDITALHLCLNRISHIATYHAPMAVTEFGREDHDRETARLFFDAVCHNRYPPIPFCRIADGEAAGLLCGGNLATVVALSGTRYALQPRGKILFFEDINECAARVERMLYQLRYNGVFASCRGVILGDFHDTTEGENEKIRRTLDRFFSPMPFPVVRIADAGHCVPNRTLPLGRRVTIGEKELVIISEDSSSAFRSS